MTIARRPSPFGELISLRQAKGSTNGKRPVAAGERQG